MQPTGQPSFMSKLGRMGVLVCGTFLLVSCASETATGDHEVGGSTAPSAASGVPQVVNPLDAVGVAACGVLSAQRLARLDVLESSARDFSNSNASRCAWKSVD